MRRRLSLELAIVWPTAIIGNADDDCQLTGESGRPSAERRRSPSSPPQPAMGVVNAREGERAPQRRRVRRHDRFAEPLLERFDHRQRVEVHAAHEQGVGARVPCLQAEVVDIPRRHAAVLLAALQPHAADRDDLDAGVLEIGPFRLVVVLGVGRRHDDARRPGVPERLRGRQHRRGRRDAVTIEHLAAERTVPGKAAQRAAGGAAVGDAVDPGRREFAHAAPGGQLHLANAVDPARVQQARRVERHANGRELVVARLGDQLSAGRNQANLRPPGERVHHLVTAISSPRSSSPHVPRRLRLRHGHLVTVIFATAASPGATPGRRAASHSRASPSASRRPRGPFVRAWRRRWRGSSSPSAGSRTRRTGRPRRSPT